MLSREQIKRFYDRFGAKQDWQRFYEGPAIRDLLAHGAFERTHAVFELGCRTGWFAKDLLPRYLQESPTYLCFDLSSTMVILARRDRLAKLRLGYELKAKEKSTFLKELGEEEKNEAKS
jgi:trans-aconitate methyltransferase